MPCVKKLLSRTKNPYAVVFRRFALRQAHRISPHRWRSRVRMNLQAISGKQSSPLQTDLDLEAIISRFQCSTKHLGLLRFRDAGGPPRMPHETCALESRRRSAPQFSRHVINNLGAGSAATVQPGVVICTSTRSPAWKLAPLHNPPHI